MVVRLSIASLLLVLAGCAGPPPDASPSGAPAAPDGDGLREWTPEALLAAAQGRPVPPDEGPTPEEIFEDAAPWALQPREKRPVERVSVDSWTVQGAAIISGLGVWALGSGEGDPGPTGPVHALGAALEWTSATGLPWQACVVRDGQPVSAVPCAEGTSPLRIAWKAAPEALPPGDYGLTYRPTGLETDVAYDLQATLEIRWTEMV